MTPAPETTVDPSISAAGSPSRRLLFLTKHGRRAASTRFRFSQFFPSLEAAGFTCEMSPLLDDRYLQGKFDRGRVDVRIVAAGFARRLVKMTQLRRFGAVIVYMEAFPYLPAFYERIMSTIGVPYTYDFDDATFHQYDQHSRWLVRTALGRKIGRVIGGAALITAGNEYLAAYARQFNPRVTIVPTVVDTERFTPRDAKPPSTEVVVGWIGSPSTSVYLRDLVDVWQAVIGPGTARLVLVGSGPIDLGPTPVTVVPWREADEIAAVQSFDIGVMPLRDDPWSKGKCGFKLIEYMACGVPVVASPVGVNAQIVTHGHNGFLCATPQEWVASLRRLIDDVALRKQLGARARDAAVATWSLKRWAPEVVGLLKEVVASAARP